MGERYKALPVRLRVDQARWARLLVQDVQGLSVSDVARLAFARLMESGIPEDELIDELVEQAHREVGQIPTRKAAGLPKRTWRQER